MKDVCADYPGHIYQLDDGQHLAFLCKEPAKVKEPLGSDSFWNEMRIVHNGTTVEEVLEVCEDRLIKLNRELPCRENREAIIGINRALIWLHNRTARRNHQNIEGTKSEV
jgi:hypothetical protein